MNFHAEGKRKFPERWRLFCDTLVAKGVNWRIADMILELPNAVDVVHALFVDADATAELVSKKSRREQIATLRRISGARH